MLCCYFRNKEINKQSRFATSDLLATAAKTYIAKWYIWHILVVFSATSYFLLAVVRALENLIALHLIRTLTAGHITYPRQQTSLAPRWPNVDPVGSTLGQLRPNMAYYLGMYYTTYRKSHVVFVRLCFVGTKWILSESYIEC